MSDAVIEGNRVVELVGGLFDGQRIAHPIANSGVGALILTPRDYIYVVYAINENVAYAREAESTTDGTTDSAADGTV